MWRSSNYYFHNYLHRDLEDRRMASLWTQSLVITLPKKGIKQQYQNYQTINLTSHPSSVMLRIILNRLKPQAERIIAEEHAGFRLGRSTTERFGIQLCGQP